MCNTSVNTQSEVTRRATVPSEGQIVLAVVEFEDLPVVLTVI